MSTDPATRLRAIGAEAGRAPGPLVDGLRLPLAAVVESGSGNCGNGANLKKPHGTRIGCAPDFLAETCGNCGNASFATHHPAERPGSPGGRQKRQKGQKIEKAPEYGHRTASQLSGKKCQKRQ